MKTFISILLSSILLMTTCESVSYEEVNYYIQNDSDETIYIQYYTDHADFCIHNISICDSINKSETFKGTIDIYDDQSAEDINHYVYIFKKSTLEKYTIEEIEHKKMYDAYYVFNALDCENNKNNYVVFKDK
ncbi:MAG: hypothetical protein IJE12_03730 [Prevotella sp.]|nr:hypothetical protein [Prevotella sp.]